MLQETAHGGGNGCPPVAVAQQDDVVVGQVLRIGLELGHGILAVLVECFGIESLRVVGGAVGRGPLDAEQVVARLLTDDLSQAVGVARLREIGDEHAARGVDGGTGKRALHLARSGGGIAHEPDARGVERHVGGEGAAIGRADVLGEVVPAATAHHLIHALFPSRGVGHGCRGVVAIPVPRPFGHVAVHVLQPEGVGFVAVGLHRVTQVAVHPVPAGIVVISVGVVAVGIRVVNVVAKPERRRRAAPGRILPFCLGGQPISVGAAVPSDALPAHGVAGCQTLSLTFGIAVGDGVIPCHILHGQRVTLALTGV